MKTDIRCIRIEGEGTYLRLEDVVAFLRELVSTETMSTRIRLLAVATKLLEVAVKHGFIRG